MHPDQRQLGLIRGPNTEGAAVISRILADGGIRRPSGASSPPLNTAANSAPRCDIELVINDADQGQAFAVLTSQGALQAVPEDVEVKRPATFERWRELAPSYRFRDRRRVRLCTPMYELPRTGDAVDDALLPFVILYSAATVGLQPVPFPDELGRSSETGYVLLSSLASAVQTVPENDGASLVPTFPQLVESEMHLLLQHATYLSPVWGQHTAQLSELLQLGHCSEGYDSLPSLPGG